jgi:alkyl sulfatase BDS1-like metallo-beta-lactamase superfamily hydrolase
MLIETRLLSTKFVILAGLLLVGCEQSVQPPKQENIQASTHTIESNKRVAESLDFTDQQDFIDAK